MSGGSWDYAFGRIAELATRLECCDQPLRKRLGAHLQLVAKAMHIIEWVDSDDLAPGSEDQSILDVLQHKT